MQERLHLTTFQLDEDSTHHMVTLMLQMTTIQNKMDLNAMAHPLWTCGTQTNQQQDRMELTTKKHSLKKHLQVLNNEHNPSTPLFLYYAPHIVHAHFKYLTTMQISSTLLITKNASSILQWSPIWMMSLGNSQTSRLLGQSSSCGQQ